MGFPRERLQRWIGDSKSLDGELPRRLGRFGKCSSIIHHVGYSHEMETYLFQSNPCNAGNELALGHLHLLLFRFGPSQLICQEKPFAGGLIGGESAFSGQERPLRSVTGEPKSHFRLISLLPDLGVGRFLVSQFFSNLPGSGIWTFCQVPLRAGPACGA